MSDRLGTPFYSLLGVSSRASSKEIQAAYIRLSREFHPDSSTEAETEERYKLITWAYAVIGRDPVVRADYDRECRARAGSLVPSEINLVWVEEMRAKVQKMHEGEKSAAHVAPRRRWWQRPESNA
ncbi:MAG TPA: DnaJ domain-containing protein [Dermatophilaceae bacterium]